MTLLQLELRAETAQHTDNRRPPPDAAPRYPTLLPTQPDPALAALEKECGLLYDEDKYARGSELLQVRGAVNACYCR